MAPAKRADTLARLMERFVAMLARSETPYPQKRRVDSSRMSRFGDALNAKIAHESPLPSSASRERNTG